MLSLTPKDTEDTKIAEVVEIREETPSVKTFRLMLEVSMDFLPGQFVFLYVTLNNERLKRAYSIASSPYDNGLIELTLKKEQHGKVSTYMDEVVKVGDKLEISKSMGKFFLTDEMKSVALIAGGSGIVPFRSMLRYCRKKGLNTKISLFYSAKKAQDIIYRQELDDFNSGDTKIIYTLTRDDNWTGYKGRINAKLISDNIDNLKETKYFLCGPLEFIRSVVEILTTLGVERQNIKREVWS